MNSTTQRYAPISAQDFLALGVNDVAYVRPIVVDEQKVFSVHAADGTQVAVMPNREVAFATVRRNEMEPLYVH